MEPGGFEKEGCSLTKPKPACKVSKATSEQPVRFMFITPALPRFPRQTVGFQGFLSFLESSHSVQGFHQGGSSAVCPSQSSASWYPASFQPLPHPLLHSSTGFLPPGWVKRCLWPAVSDTVLVLLDPKLSEGRNGHPSAFKSRCLPMLSKWEGGWKEG